MIAQHRWRKAMMGGANAQYDGVRAFSETDFTEDLRAIKAPTLAMHGGDDQMAPIAGSALRTIKLMRDARLKVYKTSAHGMHATHADTINADPLAFIRS